jgi:hypothetical protein
MLRSHENLKRVLDSIASKPNLARAMRAIGASESTIFRWLKRSAAGDPDFLVSWPEGEPPRQFVELVALARRYWSVKWEGQLRDELSEGIPRTVIHDGAIQYRKMDPRKYKEWLALGLVDEGDDFERDKHGQRIPLVVYDAAPAHLKIRGADHLLGWSETKKLDVQQRVGGVLIMKRSNSSDENESALVRDLRQRLADLEANGPKHSHPETKPVPVGRSSDEPRTDPLPPAPGARPMPNNKRLPAPAATPFTKMDDRAEGVGSAPLSAEQMAKVGGFRVAGDTPRVGPQTFDPRTGYPTRKS